MIKQTLIFHESHNRMNKRDGDEFKRMAKLAAKNYSDCVRIDVGEHNRTNKRNIVLDALSEHRGVRSFAFFCHGTANGISLGFNRQNIDVLVSAIVLASNGMSVKIALFACLTGNGFAQLLSEKLYDAGVDNYIVAHTTAGHTLYNPNKVLISSSDHGTNTIRICDRSNRKHWNEWRAKLRSDYNFALNLLSAKTIDFTDGQ